MSQLAAAMTAPDPIGYLDTAAASAAGVAYKRRLVEALDLRAGHTVLDIGCGPGTDLARLAETVTDTGTVIGVDHDPRMAAEARRRMAELANVEIRVGDAHELPLPDGCVDRAKADRVLQHLREPAQALVQARRVIRPGGLLAIAEPDWDTLAIADHDVETSRCFSRYVARRVRNATIGRELVRLATQAQFTVCSVDAVAVVLRDFDAAEQILGLRRNTARAVHAGKLAAHAAGPWLVRLAAGPFLAGFTLYLVTARARVGTGST